MAKIEDGEQWAAITARTSNHAHDSHPKPRSRARIPHDLITVVIGLDPCGLTFRVQIPVRK